MNNYYKQPVAFFGIMLPCLLMVAMAGAALYYSFSTDTKFKKKKKAYDQAQIAEQQTMELQGKVQATSEQLNDWDTMLTSETRGSFLEHWKTAEKKFSGKELTKTSHNWVNYSEGLGKGVKQPASQVNMSFSGTYKAMQMALLEVETKLPHLQLDSMTMTPSSDGESVNFNTLFTLWTIK